MAFLNGRRPPARPSKESTLRAGVALIGRTGLAATVAFTVLTVAVESVRPGFVVNWIAPSQVLFLTLAFGAASLAGSGRPDVDNP